MNDDRIVIFPIEILGQFEADFLKLKSKNDEKIKVTEIVWILSFPRL